MKKMILFILIFQIGTSFVEATEFKGDLSLHCNTNIVEVDNEKHVPVQEYIFLDGTKLNISKENASPILLINGSYKPSINVVIKNNLSLIPLRDISESLGWGVEWIKESSEIIIDSEHSKFKFKINDKIMITDDKKYKLEEPPIIINNSTYIPLRLFCEKSGLSVGYFKPSEIDLFMWNPIISIDHKLNTPHTSKENAYKYLKTNLENAFNHFEHNYITLYNPEEHLLNSSLNRLREDIDNFKFTKELSKYYIFEGLYSTIYLDKYTNDVYFNTITISGSEVKKIKFDDPKLFEYFYMVD